MSKLVCSKVVGQSVRGNIVCSRERTVGRLTKSVLEMYFAHFTLKNYRIVFRIFELSMFFCDALIL